MDTAEIIVTSGGLALIAFTLWFFFGKSEEEAVRRTAATWYSGDPNKADDTTPQKWQGDPDKEYPSIKDYSDEVLARTARLNAANSDPNSSLAEKIAEKKRQKAAFDLQQKRLEQLDH